MNQQLTYDSIRGHRGKAVVISNDAKGCYDRIAHIVAKLALRKLGASRTGLRSMIDTMQRMRHYIRTAFGNSKQTYGHEDQELPSQGILQGNGAGPATWSAICTLIVNAMKEAGFGYKQWILISKQAVTLICFAFVDNTDLIHAETAHDASTDDLLISAQDALTTWEGLITSTGRALAPKKNYWYLLDVVRRNGRWGYRHSKQDEDLVLSNNGDPQVITRHKANVANEVLGIQTRPDGKMQDERDYLLQKASQWAETVCTKRLSQSEAWCCVQSTVMKTLEHPLVATSLSRSDADTIMTPILKAILPKLGIQKKTPHSLLYGSASVQGSNLKDPWVTQLVEHLQAIMRHQHRDAPSADLHVENMELTQCHVGSAAPFWELPFDLYGCLAPRSWMKSTWEHLDKTPLTLKGPKFTVSPKRARDAWKSGASNNP